jgi:hypothetical protein
LRRGLVEEEVESGVRKVLETEPVETVEAEDRARSKGGGGEVVCVSRDVFFVGGLEADMIVVVGCSSGTMLLFQHFKKLRFVVVVVLSIWDFMILLG